MSVLQARVVGEDDDEEEDPGDRPKHGPQRRQLPVGQIRIRFHQVARPFSHSAGCISAKARTGKDAPPAMRSGMAEAEAGGWQSVEIAEVFDDQDALGEKAGMGGPGRVVDVEDIRPDGARNDDHVGIQKAFGRGGGSNRHARVASDRCATERDVVRFGPGQ